jgi:primosomal protein N' (replication factor Y)
MQTYQPEHPVIRAILAGDEEGFWKAEAAERKMAGVPPYGRMAGIILSGPDLGDVTRAAGDMARHISPLQKVGAQVYGPAPAPIARVRGKHRVRLLVKAEKNVPLQSALSRWAAGVRLPKHVRLQIDIDPQSFW